MKKTLKWIGLSFGVFLLVNAVFWNGVAAYTRVRTAEIVNEIKTTNQQAEQEYKNRKILEQAGFKYSAKNSGVMKITVTPTDKFLEGS